MMRTAPRTPNAGSSFVSRWEGSCVAEAAAELEELVALVAEGVGVVVTVTLNTTGTAVTVGMREVPLRIVVEIVAVAVVKERNVEGARVLEGPLEEGVACAATRDSRTAKRYGQSSRGQLTRFGESIPPEPC